MLRWMILYLFLVTCGIMISDSGYAGGYKRVVNFEWEEVPGAISYDLEIANTNLKNKVFSFRSVKPAWNGKLPPGKYKMKFRSIDKRGVAGQWGEESDFDVKLDAVEIEFPQNGSEVSASDNERQEINFQWKESAGAEIYQLQILNSKNESITKTEVRESKFATTLPVAEDYTFKIKSVNSAGIESPESTSNFQIIGKSLATAKIQKPENEFVRKIEWSPVPYAESYRYEILRYSPKTKNWTKVQQQTSISYEIPFENKLAGGTYQINVVANGKLRKESAISKMRFKVFSGDRSPASEFTNTVRKSIDRVRKWYGLMSYLATDIKYSSFSAENSANASFNTLGGTLRMGLGWMNSAYLSNQNWGFLGIADISGIQNEDGKILTYNSIELSAIYNLSFSARDELRIHIGPYYRELPAVIANGSTRTYENKIISSFGPHLGAEYWYALTSDWGLQTNAHLYYSSNKVQTPNQQKIIPSVSYQLGAMGSYRSNGKLTYLFGVTRREDRIKYERDTCSSCSGDNDVVVEGNYFNFYAEYDF